MSKKLNMISINDIKRTMKQHCKIHATHSSLAKAINILHKLLIRKINFPITQKHHYAAHEYYFQLTQRTGNEAKIVTTVLLFSPNNFPGSLLNLITRISRSGDTNTSELLSSREIKQ